MLAEFVLPAELLAFAGTMPSFWRVRLEDGVAQREQQVTREECVLPEESELDDVFLVSTSMVAKF